MAEGKKRNTPGITKHERKSGVRYEVRWRPGPGEGERSRSFPTYEAARAWQVQVDAAALQGHHLDPRAGKREFAGYAAEWVEARPLADLTRELYQHQLRLHINPTFGALALNRITSVKVRQWHGRLAGRGGVVAPKCYRLLRSILQSAVDDRLIPANPCTIKGAGVEHSPERPFVPPEVIVDLAAVAHPYLRAMVLVAGFGGFRFGELRDLQGSSFNEVAGTITVITSVDRRNRQKAPKSPAGKRVVNLPPLVTVALVEHIERVGVEPGGPLFPGLAGGRMSTAWHYKYWTVARAKVGAETVHFHDLRHTAGTLTAQAGATLKELMARIGHSTPRAAMRYQHAVEARDRAIADRMGEIVGDLQPRPLAPVRDLSRDNRGTGG